jgi:hypothetical protein
MKPVSLLFAVVGALIGFASLAEVEASRFFSISRIHSGR